MTENVMAEAPAPGSPETSFRTEGARGERAPSPATRHGAHGGRVVFADFGRNKVFALADDGEDVLTFESLGELASKLSPALIVVDSLPRKLQTTAAMLAKTGITFLRLRDLGKLSEERNGNGMEKTDENDIRLLRVLYRRNPGMFQPLLTTPEELEVRALTELWVELAGLKMTSKQARTTTNNPVVAKVSKMLRNGVDELSKEIHEKALNLPLYRKAFEELGLKGPSLAYIVSHDATALTTLPRDRLVLRYHMTGRRKHRGRNIRSRLLITLANTAVLHKHRRYYEVYRKHYERFKARKNTHWKAVLRVAERMLKDLHSLAKRTPDI